MSIRVLLADDHAIVRQGIKAVLEEEGFEIVGEASDGQEAIRVAAHLQPDIAILDFSMPKLNGIDAAQELAKISRKTRIILLTMHADLEYVLKALRSGIDGYILKTDTTAELTTAIRTVLQGEHYVSAAIAPKAIDEQISSRETPDPLSPRERQVLQLVAEGYSTKEIGALLFISTKTADSHRTNIMNKLDLHETASVVRYAMRTGLIQ